MEQTVAVLTTQPPWVRGPAFTTDTEIVLDESRAQSYQLGNPNWAQDLLFELAALSPMISRYEAGVNPNDAVAFVQRWGLLWHGSSQVGSGECRESLDDWLQSSNKLLFRLYFYQWLMEAPRDDPEEIARGFSELGVQSPASLQTAEDHLQSASTYLEGVINEALQGCTWELITYKPGRFAFNQCPPNLEASAYAYFAELANSGPQLKRCSGCGRPFRPETSRQKYHNQRCANATRWRRWKENKVSTT